MIGWLAVAVALLIAAGVLGFFGYEVAWRARRLQRDVSMLSDLGPQLAAVQRRLAVLQQRSATHTVGES